VEGKDLHGVAKAIQAAAQDMSPGPRLEALKSWTCHFAMHVLYALAQVFV